MRAITWSLVTAVLFAGSLALEFFNYPRGIDKVPCLTWAEDPTTLGIGLIVATFVIVLAAALFIFTRIDRRASGEPGAHTSKQCVHRFLTLEFSPKAIAVCALVILLLWSPIIVLSFPCNMGYDTMYQIYQFQTGAPTLYSELDITLDADYIDHHPVFTTLLMGGIFSFAQATGHTSIALFVFMLVQAAAFAALLAACCCYLARLGVPWAFRLCGVLFCGLFPPFAWYAMNLLKDISFSMFFLLFTLMFVEVVRGKGKALASKPFLVAFVIVAVLCVISRKTAPVTILLSWIALLVYLRRVCPGRVAVTGVSVILIGCMLWPLFAGAVLGNVQPGGRQEAIGTFMQEVIAAYKKDPSSFTEEEKQALRNICNFKQAIKDYKQNSVDPVKAQFKTDASNDDIIEFFKVWARHLALDPVGYAESVLHYSGQLYIPAKRFSFHNGVNGDSQFKLNEKLEAHDIAYRFSLGKPDELAQATDAVVEFNTVLFNNPVLGIPLSMGFYGGWLPLACVIVALYRRRPGGLVGLAPIIFSVLLFVMCPLATPRYVLPLLCTTVLMLGWAYWSAMSQDIGYIDAHQQSSEKKEGQA